MGAVIQLPQSPFSAKRKRKPPTRQRNDASRSREYLTPDEVERMIAAARHIGGRLAERDALLIMMAYRDGFRARGDRPKPYHHHQRRKLSAQG
jgi:integrase